MALQLAVESPAGHTSNYHRIVEVIANYQTRTSRVRVLLFKDQAARLASKAHVEERSYYWDGDAFPFDVVALDEINPVAAAYNKLKALPEFEGAIDC